MNPPSPAQQGDPLSIGAFAKRSRLSQKALRLYDAMGLLLPAQVDSQSGYRYYLESQLERAKLIGLLRQLEMPLQTIAKVLDLPGAEAARAISAYWAKVEADTKAKRKLVHYLEDYLSGQGESMYQVLLREVPEQKILTIQRRVYAKDLTNFIGEAANQLLGHIAKAGLVSNSASFVIYHGQVNEDSDGPVEVCVPFEGHLEPIGPMRLRLEPAHTEAYTRITKAQVEFPGILKAYDAVLEWLRGQGKQWVDAPREVYFVPWNEIGPDDPACDIAWPVE